VVESVATSATAGVNSFSLGAQSLLAALAGFAVVLLTLAVWRFRRALVAG
jgi:hypothetical protein